MATRFTIIGAGPAGVQAASYAARLGAEVTMVERDIVGGAANLWDCIPSKAMIATGGVLSVVAPGRGMGVEHLDAAPDLQRLADRIKRIETGLNASACSLLESQGVRIIEWHRTAQGSARSRRRDRQRASLRLTPTRCCSAPAAGRGSPIGPMSTASASSRPARPTHRPQMPEHLVVIGSGVTGVEFVHMFRSYGAKVTLDREPPTGVAAEGPRSRRRPRG